MNSHFGKYCGLHKVLVYGTLRRGHANHHLLEKGNAEYISTIRIHGYEMHSNGSFPFCLPVADESSSIVGEIYFVDRHTLNILDALEGVPSFYRRKQVKGMVDVELYIPSGLDMVSGCFKIVSGDWNDSMRLGGE